VNYTDLVQWRARTVMTLLFHKQMLPLSMKWKRTASWPKQGGVYNSKGNMDRNQPFMELSGTHFEETRIVS